ncbi:hypothetical protein N8I71_10980 [Roseibacterium sp. SDUM158016]|jgi:hypothetical protein|uniref:hypothetical protein n=1 Tax=Roseicyclus sediminis TaxID=2980997 RepID=UPI0021D162D5|nr:hypothetical protein [Roseibacterium sp. SDUM158016]MCU4653360.1 hypothetical protein [Roseibacterium sp. SDUM158016]
MKRLFAAFLILVGMTGVAAACPNWQNPGVQSYYTTGQDLWSPNSYSVTAGGNVALRNCGFNYTGYVISSPDFEFQLDGLQGYNRLNIRVNGNCDTVLLVNDSTGNWWFNDDTNGYNPSIDVYNPVNGTWDIWVGTYGTGTCGATLTLETF